MALSILRDLYAAVHLREKFLQEVGLKVVAFADALTIVVKGMFQSTFNNILQRTLNITAWRTRKNGLKAKIWFCLTGNVIRFADSTKSIGDIWLNFNLDILERVNKAFSSCKQATGRT